MTSSKSGIVVGACVAAAGALTAVLPMFFRSQLDHAGGAEVAANMQVFGVVIGCFGLVLVLHALWTRVVAVPQGATPAAPSSVPG